MPAYLLGGPDSISGKFLWGMYWVLRYCLPLPLILPMHRHVLEARGISVSIVSGYGLDDGAIHVRSPAEAKDLPCSLSVQTGSETHPVYCTIGTGGPFPWVNHGRGVTLTFHLHLVPRS
jgi:hypothetical protein